MGGRGPALAVDEEQIAEHGGGSGVRDAALIASAMAHPQNLAVYGECNAAALAASYAYGDPNHPFVDGNKRTAAVISEAFLMLNGVALSAADAELDIAILALAAGELTEDELAVWLREHSAE